MCVTHSKTMYQSIQLRDPFRIPIDLSEKGENILNVLNNYANMARAMCATANPPRVQQLTPETGNALKNTLNGLATYSRYLLRTIKTPIRHEYVLLGFFLEHHFGHFRR